ncbi:MAG TPA: 16S rRNA (cytosine(1402)-N(4))-methyltransferase RsmH [Solirubrobacterales bacterium]|nr:16S rRNA (cytosine(1402)-N(4))-methyltransferase RsmH [Solirubrobacterales bacterium]
MPKPTEHIPVLAPELVALCDPQPGEVAIDCTFGGGGHARLVADRLGPTGLLVCVDRDPAAAARYESLAPDLACETRFVRGDFADALAELAAGDVAADLVYMDLGVSSIQLDVAERGFSYAYDAPLDMRMDPEQATSALEVVNEWPQDRLAGVLREYGEERYAGAIAAEIVRRRPLATSAELVEAIRAAVPPAYRFGSSHPAKRSFQAIRIAVNAELDSLDRALPEAWSLLRPQGRLAVISFHSLEDRRVKRFLADRARGCVCPPELPVCVCGREPEAELLTRRAVKPSEGEAERNPRSRSARLRCARKLAHAGSDPGQAESSNP